MKKQTDSSKPGLRDQHQVSFVSVKFFLFLIGGYLLIWWHIICFGLAVANWSLRGLPALRHCSTWTLRRRPLEGLSRGVFNHSRRRRGG
jgi:hypothetical protein